MLVSVKVLLVRVAGMRWMQMTQDQSAWRILGRPMSNNGHLAADIINKINELTAANVNECHFQFLPIHNIPLRASRIYLEVPKVVIRVPVNQIYH